MRLRHKRALALLGGAAVLTLAWPGPSSADTSLGGYNGVAQAAGIRIQMYEPALPLPSNPQVDGSIGYAKANTDTGPVSRGTASYFWPGDVLGDGFNQLVGNPKVNYGVQVNSRFPATTDAPAHNTAQLTDGNGMTTSSDGFNTNASVTGLGIAGPNTDLLSGIGKGLGQLIGHPSAVKGSPELPVAVSSTLARLVTLQNMHSESSMVVGNKTITATAHTAMSTIKLLAGLITINGLDITAQTVSNGTKATNSGSVKAMEVSIAGQKLAITDKGVELAGTTAALPAVPATVMSLLDKIGISVKYAPTKHSVDGATGSFSASGLVISVDTKPLKTALHVGGLIAPLRDLVQKIPKLGDQLGPLLNLGPKIVFTIGDVSTTASAAPAFVGGVVGGGGVAGGATPGTGSVGGGSAGSSGGSVGTPGSATASPVTNPGATGVGPVQPTGLHLPGLGSLPRALILASLLAAAAVGWGLRMVGAFLFAGGTSCAHGLATGVPDLRKG